MSTIEQPAMQSGPCVICGGRNYPLSMGGPSVCPACDCGVSPQTTKLLNELIKCRAERDEARDWAIAAKLESAETRTKLESLQKACAEMRELLKLHHDWSVSNAKRGELVYMASLRHDTEHALSTDCGKDYVPKVQLESAQKETTVHLVAWRAAQMRIERLEKAMRQIQMEPMGAETVVVRIKRIATEALENEKAPNTPIATP